MIDIVIRDLKIGDLDDYLLWNHPSRKFHDFNGPYFKRKTEQGLIDEVCIYKEKFLQGQSDVFKNKKIIADRNTDKIIGVVNWYWKSQETNWLEVGIVIFNEDYWGKGIGTIALKKWINQVFDEHPEIIRIGLTTWSGNERMMQLATKLGLKLEAKYVDARIVNDKYYDSLSYGILKSDWMNTL